MYQNEKEKDKDSGGGGGCVCGLYLSVYKMHFVINRTGQWIFFFPNIPIVKVCVVRMKISILSREKKA